MARGTSVDTSEGITCRSAAKPQSVEPDQFRAAWSDLGKRLDTGYAVLRAQRDQTPFGTEQHWRLVLKLQGLDNAIELYKLLKDRKDSGNDPVKAWRTYTDAVRHADKNLNTGNELTDQAYRAGLRLGIDYQRGYGAELDPIAAG